MLSQVATAIESWTLTARSLRGSGASASEGAGHLAGLYSLVMTREANGVNSLAYLADILIRRPDRSRFADRRATTAELDAAE